MNRRVVAWTVATTACAAAWAGAAAPEAPPARVRRIALPGAPATGGVGMDFIAYDAAHGRVWVPAGSTGSVDVVDVATDAVTRIEGFPTKVVEREGRTRTAGPSSVAVADGVVLVGNRGDDTVCAIDAVSLKRGPCIQLTSMPDAIAVVPSAREAWVTTQANDSIVVLDIASADALTVKAAIVVPGAPECLAVDDARGLVYTNLEDKDRTLAVDVKTRQIVSTWLPECGEGGPHGLALDAKLGQLFVGCASRVQVLDAGHDGRRLSSLEVGDGIDAIDYVAPRHELFAAASRAGKMVVAGVDAQGTLVVRDTVTTAPSARNAVATETGAAYLTDGKDGAILVVAPAAPAPAEAAAPKRWLPDDKRRTLRSYGRNLAYNLVGVVTPGNHKVLLVTAGLTAPAFAWDDDGVDYFRRHPHENFGKIGAQLGGGVAATALTLGFFSAGRFSHGDRFRATTYDLSQAVIVTEAWTQSLKLIARRERPDGSNRQSFPSGHSSNAFCAAAVIARHYHALGVPAYALATYIATSRMAAAKHHVSDIIAGGGLGYGIGRLVVRRNSRPPEAGQIDTGPKSSLGITPYRGPSGDGRGLAVSFAF